MRTLVLLLALVLCASDRIAAQEQPYCLWVLGAPGPWPTCAGGMRTRITPYVSSLPGCVPIHTRPEPLEETEACVPCAPAVREGNVALYLVVPHGMAVNVVYDTDSLRTMHERTHITTIDGVGIYR